MKRNMYQIKIEVLGRKYETILKDFEDTNDDRRIAYLTGPQIGLAKECVVWADSQRAASLVTAGKSEYLKYL